MMTLSDEAVAAISELCGHDRDGRGVRLRSVSAGAMPTVQLEPGAVHRDRDITVSRHGVTVYVDRELAAATADKVLHVQPRPDDDRPVFLLQDQPGPIPSWPL